MRVKRLKKYKKYVNFYKVVYKFKPPFKILVDGNFFHLAVSSDFSLRDNFFKIINDTPLLVMTKCVMREMEQLSRLGKTLAEAKRVIKQSCNHSGGILPADDCIKNFVGKKNEAKVFVGTNDEELRNDLRNLGTVPIFFFQRGILVMD
jgi:U3 small nucleolar RNA-associated protein 23